MYLFKTLLFSLSIISFHSGYSAATKDKLPSRSNAEFTSVVMYGCALNDIKNGKNSSPEYLSEVAKGIKRWDSIPGNKNTTTYVVHDEPLESKLPQGEDKISFVHVQQVIECISDIVPGDVLSILQNIFVDRAIDYDVAFRVDILKKMLVLFHSRSTHKEPCGMLWADHESPIPFDVADFLTKIDPHLPFCMANASVPGAHVLEGERLKRQKRILKQEVLSHLQRIEEDYQSEIADCQAMGCDPEYLPKKISRLYEIIPETTYKKLSEDQQKTLNNLFENETNEDFAEKFVEWISMPETLSDIRPLILGGGYENSLFFSSVNGSAIEMAGFMLGLLRKSSIIKKQGESFYGCYPLAFMFWHANKKQDGPFHKEWGEIRQDFERIMSPLDDSLEMSSSYKKMHSLMLLNTLVSQALFLDPAKGWHETRPENATQYILETINNNKIHLCFISKENGFLNWASNLIGNPNYAEYLPCIPVTSFPVMSRESRYCRTIENFVP